MTSQDAADVYEAIRLAQPGGMGTEPQMDVAGPPPADLLAAMRLAQDRDRVARQYVTDFEDVFERVAPWLTMAPGRSLTERIIHTHVRLMAEFPDSLIARKCGAALAEEVQVRAARTLNAGEPGDEDYDHALADLDFWLRSDGNRRNPGTTADLIAAGLFVGFREQLLPPPWR